MKKIRNRRVYDTDTAMEIAHYETCTDPASITYKYETLYRKKTGEFFIWIDGWPDDDEECRPLSIEEAKDWCELHTTVDKYISLFGPVSE